MTGSACTRLAHSALVFDPCMVRTCVAREEPVGWIIGVAGQSRLRVDAVWLVPLPPHPLASRAPWRRAGRHRGRRSRSTPSSSPRPKDRGQSEMGHLHASNCAVVATGSPPARDIRRPNGSLSPDRVDVNMSADWQPRARKRHSNNTPRYRLSDDQLTSSRSHVEGSSMVEDGRASVVRASMSRSSMTRPVTRTL